MKPLKHDQRIDSAFPLLLRNVALALLALAISGCGGGNQRDNTGTPAGSSSSVFEISGAGGRFTTSAGHNIVFGTDIFSASSKLTVNDEPDPMLETSLRFSS